MNTPTPLIERFWAKVEITPSCWFWRGAKRSDGYGQVYGGSQYARLLYAHRVAYELLVGPIPEGLQIDHLCRTRLCVNPDHLEPVSAKENLLRGVGSPAQNARKTHCKRGHEFTPNNTYARGDGTWRECIACKLIKSKVRIR